MARPQAIIDGDDLWRRVAYLDTALDLDAAVVSLALEPEAGPAGDGAASGVALPPLRGLAFDPWGRLYVSDPATGTLLRLPCGAGGGRAEPVELLGPAPPPAGDFAQTAPADTGLVTPVSLAIDADGRLFIAERAARRIRVFDLVDRRLLRTIHLDAAPLALAVAPGPAPAEAPGCPETPGGRVLLLTGDGRLGSVDAYGEPELAPLPVALQGAEALLATEGLGTLLLLRRGAEDAAVIPLDRPDLPLVVPRAGALALAGDGTLVVARGPGEPLRRFQLRGADRLEVGPLAAARYRGDGIVADPRGRIGFWTGSAFIRAAADRPRYRPRGRITGFALDSGRYRTRWGRLFIDACIPKGTRVRVHCLALDEAPEGSSDLPRERPANALDLTIPHEDLSPAMPPRELVEAVEPAQTLYRRSRGDERPWSCPAPDTAFATYEAPVIAAPGRWLWVVLALEGGARVTPRVRSLRAEYPGHDWLDRLPQIYSSEAAPAAFLGRYLAMLEGQYGDLANRADTRHRLLDPAAAPTEALPWLAGFVGLALDRRWPEAARRTLIAEANWLFRFRGTVPGLRRMLQILLGIPAVSTIPAIIEHFKVRGLGGALVGESDALTANAVLGAGFRVGGSIGTTDEAAVAGADPAAAIDTAAHRFTVVLPMLLDAEQRAVIKRLLEVHRPAHTLYDLCTLDVGMRIGISLYTGLTSQIGRGSGALPCAGSESDRTLQLGATPVGLGHVLGDARRAPLPAIGDLRLAAPGPGADFGRCAPPDPAVPSAGPGWSCND